ncbi:XdhC family protein [Yinghuangia seranimata]|uniref:XdhC family protein n=1 Tax=Yinghuangia seranimata TaxID=408067 RepID=UPI00248CD222|nr:XdhC/CoxI family protein [Yinghuangia seranimata]MDI2124734.1 XdhC family protein [Yinghuangia seranimata]
MRELSGELDSWYRGGRTFALATVTSTLRSAPREVGAVMAVSADGVALGSVSGGCVEGAVYELAGEVIATGRPQSAAYGVSDEDALMAGLTCGGTLEVLVEPVDAHCYPEFAELLAALDDGRPVAVATVVAARDGERVGRRALSGGPGALAACADRMLAAGASGIMEGPDDDTVFVHVHLPRPRLLVFGSNDYASAVAEAAVFTGFHVTVCDARAAFATPERFPRVDELVVDWPDRYLARTRVDERTAICVLTHDPKFDVPLLERALRMPVAYVGAMGSRRAHDDRTARLREAGVAEEELARLHSPIGLALGARSPRETAIAVLAEVVKVTRGGTGGHLAHAEGRIHPEPVPVG